MEMAACQGLNSVLLPRVSDFTDRVSLTLRHFFLFFLFTRETSDIPQTRSGIKPRTHHINKNGIKNMFTPVSVSFTVLIVC